MTFPHGAHQLAFFCRLMTPALQVLHSSWQRTLGNAAGGHFVTCGKEDACKIHLVLEILCKLIQADIYIIYIYYLK